MPRPERMKSALVGWSPVDPPQQTGTVAQQEPTASADEPDRTKSKRSFYLYRSTVDELLNAAEALAATPGAPRGPSDLVNAAVEEYLETLRNRFNEGEPFPQRTGPLARGPRIR
ncbi:hypothetical protein HQ346_14485 [Rhodococcus sp. BP-252]|uniref:hypothetical protein n=2 Tax=unclassified Rhodococcus (in: high G+C Gram-positive bacteria) TaxID=192944 RepID=UPI001C9A82DF|nr:MULTISPECIES: hypothetical protein [unclassified Rhodococcus (in: high G+C Gram-positive bacteria)]MBY6432761.1 hypothetical protein [Rhodococcus sp. BP-322]MBY6446555.1 hypothetical protein [Rhodococcus sp. BP-318]MBY6451354.1 hypothetical protein [Rhodococcus sp. BP-315]MBY6456130.1 hypothetical protein [Rhodococcus sp. BP-277]MBY6460869.1 hypothetical protein [Rhodococcus sp. BP-260]MBY6466015.1 hypothetical protein [Rhodococcus sp. BP-290]MBY6495375.1 hypothetical protein [Rhodococcus